MSAENVELVKTLFPAAGFDMVEALEQIDRDIDQVGIDTGPFAEDFEIKFLSGQSGGSIEPEARGAAGLAEGWSNWLQGYETYVITPEGFADAGDEVLLLVHVRARTVRDGVELEHRPAALFQVRDGKVRRTRFYPEREMAYEAAGLEPRPRPRASSRPPTPRTGASVQAQEERTKRKKRKRRG